MTYFGARHPARRLTPLLAASLGKLDDICSFSRRARMTYHWQPALAQRAAAASTLRFQLSQCRVSRARH